MRVSIDVFASLLLGASCVGLLAAHRFAGAPSGFRRVTQQGGSFFLGLNLMHAGYWALQPIVRRCTDRSVSPATISWLSLIPAAAAAVAAGTSHWGVAAWCLLVSALLDVLDGALARASGCTSAAGAVLDSALDRYAEFMFFTGAIIAYRGVLTAQLIVLAALFGSFLVTYSTAKAEAIRVTAPRGSMKRSDRIALLVVGTALAPLAASAFGESVIAWPVILAFAVIAVLANVSAVHRFAALAQAARVADVVPSPAAGAPRRGVNGRTKPEPVDGARTAPRPLESKARVL